MGPPAHPGRIPLCRLTSSDDFSSPTGFGRTRPSTPAPWPRTSPCASPPSGSTSIGSPRRAAFPPPADRPTPGADHNDGEGGPPPNRWRSHGDSVALFGSVIRRPYQAVGRSCSQHGKQAAPHSPADPAESGCPWGGGGTGIRYAGPRIQKVGHANAPHPICRCSQEPLCPGASRRRHRPSPEAAIRYQGNRSCFSPASAKACRQMTWSNRPTFTSVADERAARLHAAAFGRQPELPGRPRRPGAGARTPSTRSKWT